MKLETRMREVMGHAHYDRMRRGMAPTWILPPWSALSEGAREGYRSRVDYLIPALVGLLGAPARKKVS